MTPDLAPNAAAISNRAFREQIKRLHGKGYELSAAEIASGLGVEIAIVESVLRELDEQLTPKSGGKELEQYEVTTRKIEADAATRVARAMEVVEEVMELADSHGVRLDAAKEIIKMGTGSLRVGRKAESAAQISVDTINILLQQGASAYERQLANAKIIEAKEMTDAT